MCISKKAIVSVTRKIPIVGKAITDKPSFSREVPSPSPQIPTPPPTQAQVLQEQINQLQERVEIAENKPPPPPPDPPPSPPPGTEGDAGDRDIPTQEELEAEAEPKPTDSQLAILRASRRAKRKALAGGRKKTVATSGLGIEEPAFGLKVTLGGVS